jgi:hypothetical protein
MAWMTKVQFLAGAGIFVSACVQTGPGTTNFLSSGFQVLSPEVKILRCEANHLPSFIAKVNVWRYMSTFHTPS